MKLQPWGEYNSVLLSRLTIVFERQYNAEHKRMLLFLSRYSVLLQMAVATGKGLFVKRMTVDK